VSGKDIMKVKIYLASQSPRRKQLLKEAGIRFTVVKSKYKEKTLPRLSAAQNAVCHAIQKGQRVKKLNAGIILAADTLIAFEGRIIGKPKNRKDARRILQQFSRRTHEVITGVAIRNCQTDKSKTFFVRSKVTFKKLSSPQIEAYLNTGEYRDKAGAYGYQEKGRALVRSVRGSRTNVIGLPMERFKKELAHFLR